MTVTVEVKTMPMVVYPRIRKRFSRLAALTALGVFASTGMAAAACPSQPTTTPFSQFGDNNSYFLAPGGSFESTGPGADWNTDNARVTTGNESFNVNAAGDSHSLAIDGGGSATSPMFCLDATMPSFRFFSRQLDGGSDLKVTLITQSAWWAPKTYTPLGTVSDGSSPTWTPVSALALEPTVLPGGNVNAQLRFSVPHWDSSWQIDDVYIDPYRA